MRSLITLLFTSLLLTSQAFAHPGRTAADGCHYCRTNCDQWGVPWNVRHCHNGNKDNIEFGELLKSNLKKMQPNNNNKKSTKIEHKHH